MKDIKSIIIGFLLATCMFLFMGQTSNESQIGRYQEFGNGVIDTATADLYTLESKK